MGMVRTVKALGLLGTWGWKFRGLEVWEFWGLKGG